MATIPTPAQELANPRIHPVAARIWKEALGQPEFADVRVIWGYSAGSGSDHRNGRCADFMVTHTDRALTRAEQVALGARIVAYFKRHAARLHVQGIIWNGEVAGYPIGGGVSGVPDVTYRGPAGQDRDYGGADQHTDHVHVQVTGAEPSSWLGPVVYLPAYIVDPLKVSSTLIGNPPAGKPTVNRAPGFRIHTGVRIDGKWLVTEAGYSYHTDYLVLEADYLKRDEQAPPVVSREEVRRALQAVDALVAGPPVEGTITALLQALDAQAEARGFVVDAEGKA